jgi:hypothetical protein
MRAGTVLSVLCWCLPTYLVVGITAALMSKHFYTSLPFHSQRLFDETWMGVAILLPIFTIVAAVKAVALRFASADNQVSVWRPVLGWGLVIVAFVLNALCYRVIADTLR